MSARRALAVVAVALLLAGDAAAAGCQVPRERRVPYALAALSNTVGPGLVNSIVGLLAVAGYAIAAPFSKRIRLPRFERSPTGVQVLAIVADDRRSHGTSLGWFVIERSDTRRRDSPEDYQLHELHETGHAVQSALLGPLYLPFIALDYAIHGGGNHRHWFHHRSGRGGFSGHDADDAWVETWADRIAAKGGKTRDLSAAEIREMTGCDR